jgi:hypothetical protein
MRYRLRTLLMVLGFAPPIIAGVWLAFAWLSRDRNVQVLVPIAIYAAFYAACVALAVNLKRIGRTIFRQLSRWNSR